MAKLLRGKGILKRTFCAVSSFVIMGGYCVCPIIATSRTEQRRQAKAELQNKRKELAKELQSAKDNVNEEAEKKKNLDAQIDIVQKQIDESNAYIDDLANVIAGLCCAFDPERIALGGGFSAAGEVLYGPLNRLVAERNFYRVPYEIVPARFLNDAGVIGAAYYAQLTSYENDNKIDR